MLIVSPVKDQDDHFPVKCAVQIGMTSFITRVSRIETYEKDVYFDVQFSGPRVQTLIPYQLIRNPKMDDAIAGRKTDRSVQT